MGICVYVRNSTDRPVVFKIDSGTLDDGAGERSFNPNDSAEACTNFNGIRIYVRKSIQGNPGEYSGGFIHQIPGVDLNLTARDEGDTVLLKMGAWERLVDRNVWYSDSERLLEDYHVPKID